MTDEEVEVVAQELAKAGGISWYPGRQTGTMLRVVTERYRDQARVVIQSFDNLRAAGGCTPSSHKSKLQSGTSYRIDGGGSACPY
jgi:hypothetical protein